jgi:hypothetical protein
MSDEAKRKRGIIRLPSPRQQALYDRNRAIFVAMLLDCKDG